MSKRRVFTVILTVLAALILVFASFSVVLADKGGIPNAKAENGAEHSNDNSAHHRNGTTAACDECGCSRINGLCFNSELGCACDAINTGCVLEDEGWCSHHQSDVVCECLDHLNDPR
jgi:hypothetical protein